MLSRVADSFYWVNRYLERAEHSARVLNVHLSLTLDDPTNTVGESLLDAVGAPPGRYTPPVAAPNTPTLGRIDPRHRAAVSGCVIGARENARQIREQISSEMWEQLNRMYLLAREADRSDASVDAGAFLRSVVDGAHLFHGIAEATLSHGEGWHYLQLGKYIERATTTAAMLESYFSDPPDAELAAGGRAMANKDIDAIGLLRACAAFEPYCRQYTAEIRPERVAEFLLLNADFPRSVRFAVDRLEDSLRAIARFLGRPANGRPERYAGQLRAALNYGQIDEIMADSLVAYVQRINQRCEQVHGALYETYIAYPIETAIAR